MAAMNFYEFEQRDLALLEQISHYEQASANLKAQIAMNEREIAVLALERAQLRTQYACGEFAETETPQRGLCGNKIPKDK